MMFLVIGGLKNGGYISGIGTLKFGRAGKIQKESIVYHVLINVFSTALLTASNYCMQVSEDRARKSQIIGLTGAFGSQITDLPCSLRQLLLLLFLSKLK